MRNMSKVVGLQSKRTARPSQIELLCMYRKRSGLTQSELAQRLGLQSDRMVRKWEKGYSLPDAKRLQKLLEVYLQLGIFTSKQEEEEAQALWAAVKEAFENHNDSFQTYPLFDKIWFNAVVGELNLSKAVLNRTEPTSLERYQTVRFERHNLPFQINSFVGRNKEVEAIKYLLESTSLLTITGPGGTGKTRLALEIGRELIDQFKDGVWLVELADLPDQAEVTPVVATVLGPGVALQLNALVAFLKLRELLLILDNCEHLLESCATLVSELLRNCPHLKIVIASRESLGMAGETIYQLEPLSFSEKASENISEPPKAPLPASSQLFIERAKALQPDFSLNPEQLSVVMQICQRLDGLPLAIELAALKVDLLTVEQIGERLDNLFGLLKHPSPVIPSRQQSLQACFDWSYRRLSQKERYFFQNLSELEGDFTLQTLQEWSHLQHLEKMEILDLLDSLVKKSLVVILNEKKSEQITYRLLETIRKYAQEKLHHHNLRPNE